MKYVAPAMENMVVLAADVITTSTTKPVLPDDEF